MKGRYWIGRVTSRRNLYPVLSPDHFSPGCGGVDQDPNIQTLILISIFRTAPDVILEDTRMYRAARQDHSGSIRGHGTIEEFCLHGFMNLATARTNEGWLKDEGVEYAHGSLLIRDSIFECKTVSCNPCKESPAEIRTESPPGPIATDPGGLYQKATELFSLIILYLVPDVG